MNFHKFCNTREVHNKLSPHPHLPNNAFDVAIAEKR